jgi:glycosyltransferase involved in cell wall biosynthesis
MISEKTLNKCANDFINTTSESATSLVTIGITNYNGENYLDECIASILHQSIKSIEIIIVDDNSCDTSIEKIKNLEKQYKNIRAIYHRENSGSPDLGRQEIINEANGSYFMLVDSDDYFGDNMTIEKLLNEFKKIPGLDYVYCNMLVVDKSSKPIGLWTYRQYSDDELVHDTFQRGGSGVIPMKGMFKRDFFIKNQLSWHNNETAGDTLSALIYTKHGWEYKHIDLNLLCYRQYGESFSYNLEKRVKAIITILEYIIDNFSEEVYFSKIPWKQFDSINRENIKMYLLGQFYYEVLKVYYSQWSSLSQFKSENQQKIIESLSPLKNQVLLYLNKCNDTHHLFYSNIEKTLIEVKEMFQI